MQIPIPFFPNSSFAYFEKINDAGLKNDSTEGELNRPRRMPWWKQIRHGMAQVLKEGKFREMAKIFPFKPVLGKTHLAIRSLANYRNSFSPTLNNLWRREVKDETF